MATINLTNDTSDERMIGLFDPSGGLYDTGYNTALSNCGIAGGGTVYTGTVRQLYDPDLDVYVNAVNPYVAHTVSAR